MSPKPYGYQWEKMHSAVTSLMDHPGRIQERVLAATIGAHSVLSKPEEFPPDTRTRVQEIHARMTAAPDSGEGSFAASAGAMSDEEATQIAKWFWEVYSRVHKLSGAEAWMGEKLDPITG